MPFLTEVSLGHELVHQWAGVGVSADIETGNWAEGLTTYYADRLYADMKGEGAEYRKKCPQKLYGSLKAERGRHMPYGVQV